MAESSPQLPTVRFAAAADSVLRSWPGSSGRAQARLAALLAPSSGAGLSVSAAAVRDSSERTWLQPEGGQGVQGRTLTRLRETRAAGSVAALPEVSWLPPRGQRSESWRDSARCVGAAELEEGRMECRRWKSALGLGQAGKFA